MIRVRRILIVIWALNIFECIPLIHPIEVLKISHNFGNIIINQGGYSEFNSPIRTVGVALEVKGYLPNLIYQVFPL